MSLNIEGHEGNCHCVVCLVVRIAEHHGRVWLRLVWRHDLKEACLYLLGHQWRLKGQLLVLQLELWPGRQAYVTYPRHVHRVLEVIPVSSAWARLMGPDEF